jgi:hypothetical protein
MQQEERTAKSDEKAMQTDADSMRPGREGAMATRRVNPKISPEENSIAIAEENATQQKEEEGQLEETEEQCQLCCMASRSTTTAVPG